MRDPNRIDTYCKRLAQLWKIYPDWRFGQLIQNIESIVGSDKDVYYMEDEELFKEVESKMYD